jgi:hypothetical protein
VDLHCSRGLRTRGHNCVGRVCAPVKGAWPKPTCRLTISATGYLGREPEQASTEHDPPPLSTSPRRSVIGLADPVSGTEQPTRYCCMFAAMIICFPVRILSKISLVNSM